jgi:hypothetical protein
MPLVTVPVKFAVTGAALAVPVASQTVAVAAATHLQKVRMVKLALIGPSSW